MATLTLPFLSNQVVFLYDSVTITHLNAILWVVTEPALYTVQYVSSNFPHPPLKAALPTLYGSITFTHLEENSSMGKLPYPS